MNKEYTIKELATAARHCIKAGSGCSGCPFYKKTNINCFQKFMQAIIQYQAQIKEIEEDKK